MPPDDRKREDRQREDRQLAEDRFAATQTRPNARDPDEQARLRAEARASRRAVTQSARRVAKADPDLLAEEHTDMIAEPPASATEPPTQTTPPQITPTRNPAPQAPLPLQAATDLAPRDAAIPALTDAAAVAKSDPARLRPGKAASTRPPQQFRPPVSASTMKLRHYGLAVSFVLCVLVPVVVSGWYLWARAADQYASYVGFSVQKEDTDPAVALLGGITSLSTSSSSDTDILYEYMYSQSLVAEIDAELDLRALWSKPENDPVFSYAPPGTIEDLTDHWADMVKVFYDSNTRLIELRVLAFDPQDAKAIATAIYNKSSAMINKLADTSRDDAVRYAKEELDAEQARLREARTAVTAYRNLNRMVDPSADVASQSGLLGNLQTQLAEAMIELDTLRLSSQDGDPRIVPAERKVKVIEDRIDAERNKLGSGTGVDAAAYAGLVAEYEGLAADREFAEGAYRAALAAYDAAKAEARRQGRYLAAHVTPTLAEAPRFPDRPVLLGLIALFAFVMWAIAALLYYSLRDRR